MKKYSIFTLCILLVLITGCSKDDAVNKNEISTKSKIKVPTIDSSSGSEEENIDIGEGVPKSEGDIIEIRERMFITQINEIFLNLENYKGKQIKLEGFMYISQDQGKTYNYVVRNSPGCCGNDGLAGFEFIWDGDMPKENQWLEVVGVLDLIKEEDGLEYPVLRLNKLEVKQERGKEFVPN